MFCYNVSFSTFFGHSESTDQAKVYLLYTVVVTTQGTDHMRVALTSNNIWSISWQLLARDLKTCSCEMLLKHTDSSNFCTRWREFIQELSRVISHTTNWDSGVFRQNALISNSRGARFQKLFSAVLKLFSLTSLTPYFGVNLTKYSSCCSFLYSIFYPRQNTLKGSFQLRLSILKLILLDDW